MKNLLGTKTEQNLREAFAGETMAHAKYQYYCEKAKQDGYEQIAAIFKETSDNEKEHAEIWFKYLHENQMPATLPNLNDAAQGEKLEWTEMYARMAQEAREEGFTEIAASFDAVAKIEKEHEERYNKLIKNLENNNVFTKDGDVVWKCRNCGHIHLGKSAPIVCPVCKKPQAYFEEKCENY